MTQDCRMKNNKTRKITGTVKPSKHHINHPQFFYHSEHTSYTSHPNSKNSHGMRTTVNIKNKAGEKRLEILNKKGKTVKAKTYKLKVPEMRKIKLGKYVSGLWRM